MSSETPYLVEQRDRQAQLAVPRPVHGRPTMSSGVEPQTSADVEVIGQWLEALGLISADEETGSLPEILADGTVLCRLANRIKPRSVENVSLLWGSGNYKAVPYLLAARVRACVITHSTRPCM